MRTFRSQTPPPACDPDDKVDQKESDRRKSYGGGIIDTASTRHTKRNKNQCVCVCVNNKTYTSVIGAKTKRKTILRNKSDLMTIRNVRRRAGYRLLDG